MKIIFKLEKNIEIYDDKMHPGIEERLIIKTTKKNKMIEYSIAKQIYHAKTFPSS